MTTLAQTLPAGPSRFTGLAAVILIHAVLATGLMAGLQRQPVKPVPPLVQPELPREMAEPPPPAPLLPPEVKLTQPELPQIPLPVVDIVQEIAPVITARPMTDSSPTIIAPQNPGHQAQPVAATQASAAGDQPVTAGMACTRMSKSELPAVNWSGEAMFRVTATVSGGRVVGTEFQSLRGGIDAKSRRALQSAIDATLRESYECPGARSFVQEFQLRID